jgi:hypothetical protein
MLSFYSILAVLGVAAHHKFDGKRELKLLGLMHRTVAPYDNHVNE